MDDREKQVLFLKRLRETKAKADENGKFITEAELEKAFADLDLDGAQQKQVKDYLKSSGIGIGEALSFEEVSTQEERDYLAEYETMIGTIELPSDNVLDAVRLSAMAGDAGAQSRLVECSLRKVIDIARLYAGQGVYVEDLIGTGNETLLRAVTQLAPLEKPEEVDGYLGRRIMDAMEDLIAQNLDEKAVEKEVEDKVNLLADRAKELAQMLGRKVSVQELADEYKMDPDEIEEVIKLSGNAIGDIQ
jgi:RNA polymerase primary sigma factor